MKRALVLGGGGLVGMDYHAGVLLALEEAGIDPRSSDLIVGTSAGAIMAAYLSSGWSPSDLFGLAHEHDAAFGGAAYQDELEVLFAPLWRNSRERLRRIVGGAFVTAAARGHWGKVAGGRIPGPRMQAAFPSGLYASRTTRRRLRSELSAEWPREGLYVCAVELYSGRRVAFGSPGAPRARFFDAVLASAAIPGIFEPVRVADRLYVDGGVRSTSSMDLAVEAGCERIVCIAPLGWQAEKGAAPYKPPFLKSVLLRSWLNRALKREAAAARASGVEVILLRPWLTELPAHGTNSLGRHSRADVAESARLNTLKLLGAS